MKKYKKLLSVIVGSGFDDTEKGPYFILDNFEATIPIRTKQYLWNLKASIETLEVQICTGAYNILEFKSLSCPHKNFLNNDKNNFTQCYKCFQQTGFNPAFYNTDLSFLSDQQTVYNKQPHIVYLAFFGTKKIKIGISNQKRYFERWLEQGALLATIIDQCDNVYKAREIESNISKNFKIPEVVFVKTKQKLLSENTISKDHVQYLKNFCEKTLVITEPKTIHTLINFYSKEELPKNFIYIESMKDISGDILFIGLVGKIIFFKYNYAIYAISIDKIIGKTCLHTICVKP